MPEPDANDLEQLEREIGYYRHQVDALGGEILKLDYTVSGLRHELKQKRQAFAVLSDLQESIAAPTDLSALFERAIRAINATLGMDKTVVLVPTDREDSYRPSQWLGFVEESTRRFVSSVLSFPHEFARGTAYIVANKASPTTPLIDQIRATFELPYFISVSVAGEGAPLGLLLAGRLKEAKPLYPPFDQGDIATFQAIAGFISSYIRNLRVHALEETDRLKTAFFANVSHELRTPITLTLGPIAQILDGRYGSVPDGTRRQLHMALRNQEQLLVLVNQILDLAKFEAGGMELRAAPITDVNRFLEAQAARFASVAEERGLEFRFTLDPRLRGVDLYIDRAIFGKLFSNLLSNALKFTKQGSVDVMTELHGNAFRLTVTDTGIGIRPDQLPYVFDRFRQADDSESRKYGGTGIGLALVKQIAELHGGDVRAYSQHGSGSTFQVNIPLGKMHLSPASVTEVADEDLSSLTAGGVFVVESEASTSDAGAESPPELDPARSTILYAEDNRDLRNHVRDMLADEYNVVLAVNGRDGLEKARRYKPDLILTDQMMPEVSGRELLDAIRSDPGIRATPVIFLTARSGTEARIEGLSAGANDYLAKPFHAAELIARVRNLLQISAQERELAALNFQLAEWNRTLEQRVQDQVSQLERLGRLKRFFSQQLAELIVDGGAEDPLKSHRREVVVVFLDLRGFTAFSETADPEEIMGVLRDYHAEMGQLILKYEGTLERFTGDGMMVFFNDPVPVPNPAERALRMAVEMRDQVAKLITGWRKRGYELEFGIGIAQGYATIGAIGFEGRWDYGAIGTVTNLAARLCGEARPGQILIPERVRGAAEDLLQVEPIGQLSLKGFHRPVAAYNVIAC